MAACGAATLTHRASAVQTVAHARFVTTTQQIGVRVISWPGGNTASAYDWKRNELINPVRRMPQPNGVDIARILQCRADRRMLRRHQGSCRPTLTAWQNDV